MIEFCIWMFFNRISKLHSDQCRRDECSVILQIIFLPRKNRFFKLLFLLIHSFIELKWKSAAKIKNQPTSISLFSRIEVRQDMVHPTYFWIFQNPSIGTLILKFAVRCMQFGHIDLFAWHQLIGLLLFFPSRAVFAGSHKFVFLVRGPLILVAVSYGKDSTAQVSGDNCVHLRSSKMAAISIAVAAHLQCYFNLFISGSSRLWFFPPFNSIYFSSWSAAFSSRSILPIFSAFFCLCPTNCLCFLL